MRKLSLPNGFYPLSRQNTSARLIEIIYEPSDTGRPRQGEWRPCVMCGRRFYARPCRKTAYTCSPSCACKISGKFRWLKYDKSLGEMSGPQIYGYIVNLLPFDEERNPEAWQHFFNRAYSLIAEGTLGRDPEFERTEPGVYRLRAVEEREWG